MANQHRARGDGGRADHRRNQTTTANEPPIDLGTITPEELDRRSEALGKELARQH